MYKKTISAPPGHDTANRLHFAVKRLCSETSGFKTTSECTGTFKVAQALFIALYY